jgi:septal ring factor EnvC (AmiA/AmiB activator)
MGGNGAAALHQRVQEMQDTLTKMHALLKEMRSRAKASGSKDVAATENLDMWALMLSHLERDFTQLQAAAAARDDLEARRAAMYSQAMAKADKERDEALKARANQAGIAAKSESAPKSGEAQPAPTSTVQPLSQSSPERPK